jgi:hypothetical protein
VELRVAAAPAREEKIVSAILAGEGLHELTADEIAAAGVEMGRDTATMTNFLIVYGGGGKALAEQAGIPREIADTVVATFRQRFSSITAMSKGLESFTDAVRTISHRHVPMPINAKDARPNRSEAGTWGYKGRRLFVGNDPAHIAPRAPNGWAGPLRRAATWGAKPTAGTAPRSHPALSRMPGRRSGRGITITPAPPTHHPVASPNASRRGHSMTETSVGPSILRLLALQATVMPAARAAVGPRRPGSVSLPHLGVAAGRYVANTTTSVPTLVTLARRAGLGPKRLRCCLRAGKPG